MRKAGRVVVLFLLSLVSTAVLTAATVVLSAVSLAATVLIVPGTGTPDANGISGYMTNFRNYYMQTPCSTAPGGCPDNGLVGVNYPASFWPIPLPGWCPNLSCDTFNVSVAKGVQNLETDAQNLGAQPYLIAGYSQGARVASIAKMRYVNGEWAGQTPEAFVFIGNPNRPNGGLLSRLGFIPYIPILNITTGQPTPTNSDVPTEDWAIRWEGIADWPTYILNPLAVVNSLLGFYYDHGTYLAFNAKSDPGETPAGYTLDEWRELTANPGLYPDNVNIQQYGDTTYYTVTPKTLPLVRPLHLIPLIGKPIADLFEPVLRVLIEETGYARWLPFGAPIGTGLIPIFNPITLFLKLIPAVFVGINNFLANFGLTTAIPLTPNIPVPAPVAPVVSSLDEQQQPEDNADDSSAARMSLVQDNGAQEEGGTEGEENQLLAQGETEGDLTVSEGTVPEGTVPEGTMPEGTVPEGTLLPEQTPIEETPIEPMEGQNGEHENEANQGHEIVGVLNKDPEENKDPVDNRVDANGGSVSLNFSPNKPAEGPTGGGEGPSQLDPVAEPQPAADAEGAEGSEDPAQAAA